LTGQKYSIDKIIRILSEAKMTSVSAVCRKYDVCPSTFYRWQKQYSNASAFSCAFSSDQAKKLAILESENASLKKLVAEKELENDALRDFIKKKRPLRDFVTFMREQRNTVRVICRGFGLSRATLYRYLSSPVSQDSLSKRITELAYKHPQYGYRRIRALLIKEGIVVNNKKVYLLYTRRKLRLFFVIDDFTRLIVGLLVDFSIPAYRVQSVSNTRSLTIPAQGSFVPTMAPNSERPLSIVFFPSDGSNTSSSNRAGLIKTDSANPSTQDFMRNAFKPWI